jgi:hypothetical protein
MTTALSAGAMYNPGVDVAEETRLYAPHAFDAGRKQSDAPAVPHDYDVREYIIDLDLDDTQEEITGECTITARSLKDNLSQVEFNLEDEMNVTAVTEGGEACTFSHNNKVLTVTLRTARQTNEDFTIKVTYDGSPLDGLYFTNKGVYCCSAMEEAQHWFPCYDLPDDKADRVELIVTCRDDWYVAANGVLASETNNQNGTKTFKWVTEHRIATYLISISGAYEYSRFGTTWSGVPVNYYVFPEHRANAEICFEYVPQMMNFFSNKFWRYPFDDERYGVAEAEMGYFGGMENQTCITLNQLYVRPNHSSDNILAHELSHMWWGDCISPGSWKNLWLNEGLATYCDALWVEHDQGEEAFHNRMTYFANLYFAEDGNHRFPVFDPAEPWSATVYEKGAWVMHMLRYLMGDDKFFRAWNTFGREHEFGHAFTYELQRTMEEEYGQSLDEFFNDWVYKAGYPVYQYDWTTNGNRVTVEICQVQQQGPITPLFDMPLELKFTTQSNGTKVERVVTDSRYSRFTFEYGSPVTAFELDPDGWVLCKKENVVGIGVAGFDARPGAEAVVLSWKTNEGADIAGFNLYREEAGDAESVKLNGELITGSSPYEYRDAGLEAGNVYSYTLEVVDVKGGRERYGPVECRAGERPRAFAIHGNYPNPASASTTVSFCSPEAGTAAIRVYDLAGRRVMAVTANAVAVGDNEVVLDVSALAPGVYAYRVEVGDHASARKLVIAD